MSNSPKFFPFDEDSRFKDDTDPDVCPSCHKLFSKHSKSRLVKCALVELGGD